MNANIQLIGLLAVTFVLVVPTARRATDPIVDWLSDFTETHRITR